MSTDFANPTNVSAPPTVVARVAALMSSYRGPWALCGGWAVDAWHGRPTREHHDVDVAVRHEDQRTLFEHLAGWRLIGHDDHVDDDSEEPWDGRPLAIPAHVHTRTDDGFEPEFHLNECDGETWIFRRSPRVAIPIEHVLLTCPWGVPTLSPHAVLFYKALPPMWRGTPRSPPRACDEQDLGVLLPLLTGSQIAWAIEAIGQVEPDHPWLRRLGQ